MEVFALIRNKVCKQEKKQTKYEAFLSLLHWYPFYYLIECLKTAYSFQSSQKGGDKAN